MLFLRQIRLYCRATWLRDALARGTPGWIAQVWVLLTSRSARLFLDSVRYIEMRRIQPQSSNISYTWQYSSLLRVKKVAPAYSWAQLSFIFVLAYENFPHALGRMCRAADTRLSILKPKLYNLINLPTMRLKMDCAFFPSRSFLSGTVYWSQMWCSE